MSNTSTNNQYLNTATVWQNVSPENPCPICGKSDWCTVSIPAGAVLCRRADYHPTFGRGTLQYDSNGAAGSNQYYYYTIAGNGNQKISKPSQSNRRAQTDKSTNRHAAAASSSKSTSTKSRTTLSPEKLHEVYTFILNQLELSPEHNQHLLGRGFTAEQIKSNLYRTLPSAKTGYRTRIDIANAVVHRFGESVARETPGVYWKIPSEKSGKPQAGKTSIDSSGIGNQSTAAATDSSNNEIQPPNEFQSNINQSNQTPATADNGYFTLAGTEGLIIPVRNIEQQICLLKIRSFDPATIAKYGKYLALSSASRGGCSAGDHCHVVYDSSFVDKTLFVTEGELKAELASTMLRRSFISLPGAGKWRFALPVIERLSARAVVIAFDNDLWTNPHVAGALRDLHGALINKGVDTAIADWRNSPHKGIDDLLTAGSEPRYMNGDSARQLIEDAIAAAAAENPTPAQTALAEALCTLTGFSDAVASDIGYIYETRIIEALYFVERQSPQEWARLQQVLLKYKQVKLVDKQFKIIEEKRQSAATSTLPASNTAEVIPINESVTAEHAKTLPILQECIDSPLLADAAQMHIPAGYAINESGIWKMPSNPHAPAGFVERIFNTPSFIRKLYFDYSSETYSAEIAWHNGRRWVSKNVKKSQLMDSRKIVALSDFGLPVSSNTSGELSKFYLEFESENIRQLPCETVSSSMSWQRNRSGEIMGCLIGEKYIPAPSEKDKTKNYVNFQASDNGESELAKSVQSKGELSEWMGAVAKIHDCPRAMVMVYASFASVLLPLIKCPSFIVDLSCKNSKGKTSTLRIAASVWGNPDERQENSFINTYNATNVWMERTAGTLRNLPLIIDDTKQVRFKKSMSDIIYNFCASKGRQRGTISGTASTKSWNSILLSTGEEMITDYTEGSGGASARVLPIDCPNSPFEGTNKAQMIYEIDSCIKENYGHAGIVWIEWILEHQERIPIWQTAYRDQIRNFVEMVRQISSAENQSGEQDLSAITRICEYIAAIDIAGTLVHQALDMPFAYGHPFQFFLVNLQAEFSNTDKPALALQDVCSWAVQNIECFITQKEGSSELDRPSRNGDLCPAGRWDHKYHGWEYIAFSRRVLRRILEDHDYNNREIIRAWKNNGWLETEVNAKDRYTKKISVGNCKRDNLIAIKRCVTEHLVSGNTDDDLFA